MVTHATNLGYANRFVVTRVVDGDTLLVEADLGYHVHLEQLTYRLARINCPEAHAPGGQEATAFTMLWIQTHSLHTISPFPLLARTSKTDDWRRWLAEVTCLADGANVSDDLLAAGHAVRYLAESPRA